MASGNCCEKEAQLYEKVSSCKLDATKFLVFSEQGMIFKPTDI